MCICFRTTHSNNNNTSVSTTAENVSTSNHYADKCAADNVVVARIDNRDTPVRATLKRTNSVIAKTREFQSILDNTTTSSTTTTTNTTNTTTSDVNSNVTGIF